MTDCRPDRAPPAGSRPRHGVALAGLAAALALVTVWAVTVGSSAIPPRTVLAALFHFDGSREHIVVTSVRLPRVLAALLAGSTLAVAGAIMQGVTGNPLASPGLLGINAGAAFAVVTAIVLAGTGSSAAHVWYAFGGAAAAAAAVYLLGSFGREGATPLKLALAGAIVSTFLASLTTAILIFDRDTLDNVRLWTVGSLAGRQMPDLMPVIPYAAAGLAAALLTARQITTLSFGADVARSLGQNQRLWRLLAGLIVVLLAGSAVAVAGPVGFVGLVVPHMARLIVGVDYRRIIPFSALAGPILVIAADALLRHILPGRDIPVGVTMALIGAPFFIYLARYRIGGAR